MADSSSVGSALPASSPTTASVDLVPSAKPNVAQTDELQITAVDLTDSLGRALDGNNDGQPGGNFVATFTKNGLALARPSARAELVKLSVAAVAGADLQSPRGLRAAQVR